MYIKTEVFINLWNVSSWLGKFLKLIPPNPSFDDGELIKIEKELLENAISMGWNGLLNDIRSITNKNITEEISDLKEIISKLKSVNQWIFSKRTFPKWIDAEKLFKAANLSCLGVVLLKANQHKLARKYLTEACLIKLPYSRKYRGELIRKGRWEFFFLALSYLRMGNYIKGYQFYQLSFLSGLRSQVYHKEIEKFPISLCPIQKIDQKGLLTLKQDVDKEIKVRTNDQLALEFSVGSLLLLRNNPNHKLSVLPYREMGVIKNYNQQKKYGFIETVKDEDLFFHNNNSPNFKFEDIFEVVSFIRNPDKKHLGKFAAVDLHNTPLSFKYKGIEDNESGRPEYNYEYSDKDYRKWEDSGEYDEICHTPDPDGYLNYLMSKYDAD